MTQDDSLVNWIKLVKDKMTRGNIVQKLIETGWSNEIISRAIDEVYNTTTIQESDTVVVASADVDTTNKSNLIDLGDKVCNIVLELTLPRIIVIENFLSDEECAAIIELATPSMTRSSVVDRESGGNTIHEARTSDGMFLAKNQTPIVQVIEERMSRLVNWPIENGEGMQVLKYGIGAEYKPHNDWFSTNDKGSETVLSRGGNRVGTVLCYLNNVISGGGTIFPESNLEVKPKKGSAIFFGYPTSDNKSKTLHGGSPVVEGEKWVCVKWFRERVFT